jgi:PAS domain S-box-containing protein
MADPRILIVDGSKSVALDIHRSLSSRGYLVDDSVCAGSEALARVAALQPDLVLMDVQLPGKMDGIQAAAAIRARFDVPVVYLVKCADDETLQRARSTDPYGYVRKPIDGQDLLGTIQVALDRHRAEQALRQAYDELELCATRRTAELIQVNERLEHQIRQCQKVDSALQQRNHELVQRGREWALLNLAARAFNSSLDLNHVLVTILEQVRHVLDADGCSIWLLDADGRELVGLQASGYRSEIVRGWRLPVGEGIAGWVAQRGESLIVPDTRLDDRHFVSIDRQTELELKSILSVPLKVKERVFGVLQVLAEETDRFDKADMALLEPLAASAATAIENARLYQETESLRAFNDNIVQSMEEGILLEDAEGGITFCNRRAAELLGYSRQQLVGQPTLSLVVLEQRARVEHDRLNWLQETISGYETELLTRDGYSIPVLISSRPLFDDARFDGLLCVFTDITRRRQAEDALKRQNELLVTLNAIAAAMTHVLNLDQVLDTTLGKILEMLGIDAGWIHLEDKAGGRIISEVIRSKEPIVFDAPLDTSQVDGADVPQELSWTVIAIPIQARDIALGVLTVACHRSYQPSAYDLQTLSAIGHQIGMAAENRQLLEEASELEVLRELDRFRSELVANVSHELRTPLGLIKIFCTTLMRDDVEFDRQTQLEFLHDIELETDRLEEIVGNLLDTSRVESGRLRLDKCPTDIGQLVREVMDEMESQITLHCLVCDFPSWPLVASVDYKRVARVLRNLLSNAVKYSPKGGTITVQGRDGEGQVVICVSDKGIGIAQHDLPRVFERFYRIESDATRNVGGIGLGLAVCQGIIEAHGGRIWVESVLGVGSDFYFSLPSDTVSELSLGQSAPVHGAG